VHLAAGALDRPAPVGGLVKGRQDALDTAGVEAVGAQQTHHPQQRRTAQLTHSTSWSSGLSKMTLSGA